MGQHQPPADPLPAAREYLFLMAAGTQTHAEVVKLYAEMGNDPGTLYAARCLAAYLRSITAGIEELERCRGLAAYRRAGATTGPDQRVEDRA